MQRVNLVTTTASLAVQYNHIKDSQYVESQEPSNWTVSWLSHQWSKKNMSANLLCEGFNGNN